MPTSRTKLIAVWILQVLVGATFIAAGIMKLTGNPMMVQIFEHIGFGQWFRHVTGLVELTGGILLFVPRTAPYAAILLIATMACAVCTHLLLIGGSPAPAITLLVLSAAILWQRGDVRLIARNTIQGLGDDDIELARLRVL